MKAPSSVAVIVVSKGRPEILKETVEGLLHQTLKPSQIIVVVPSAEDLPAREMPDAVEIHTGVTGLCRQRNLGLEKVAPNTDYVAFFDDDMELRSDYLEKGVKFLDDCPGVAAFSGKLVRDGGVDREKARQLIADYHPVENYEGAFIHGGKLAILYGCCMIIRRTLLTYEKFDENLPLYCFGEDYDISIRLRRYGIIGRYQACIGVHFRSPGGRVSEVQRGYAIVANNWYFLQKGVTHLPPLPGYLRFWLVIFFKLLIEALWQELLGDKSLDWRGRARGFLLAAADILLGQSSPQRMLDYSEKP
jgi:GT2 family glycosyltransferase